MMTSTLFTPWDVPEAELAALLERRFGAAWFPQYHRCSIDTDDAVVFVDYDPTYVGWLTPDDRRALAARLGFEPTVALHMSSSTYHRGSPALAELVARALGEGSDAGPHRPAGSPRVVTAVATPASAGGQ